MWEDLHNFHNDLGIAEAIQNSILIGVGIVLTRKASLVHQFILEAKLERCAIKGGGPIKVDPEAAQSTHVETKKVLAMVMLVNAIENYVEGHNGSATIYCNHDNAVSVQPLQMASYFKHCQMYNDLNTTILYESAASPILFNFKEVEGNAGKHPMIFYEDAEQQVRRNIDAGWGAKLFLETANSDGCDLTPLLPQRQLAYTCVT